MKRIFNLGLMMYLIFYWAIMDGFPFISFHFLSDGSGLQDLRRIKPEVVTSVVTPDWFLDAFM